VPKEDGFTLIELLTTMSIIGILAAISFAQFMSYQSRAFDARAEHTLRTAITAEEAYFADNELYVECEDSACELPLESFTLSSGTRILLSLLLGGEAFSGRSSHPNGVKEFNYNSETGQYSSG
jgi:prepilin-type N-terminal cleavage/methylation domain-containing protein